MDNLYELFKVSPNIIDKEIGNLIDSKCKASKVNNYHSQAELTCDFTSNNNERNSSYPTKYNDLRYSKVEDSFSFTSF